MCAHQYIKDKCLINICRYDDKRRGNVNEAEQFKGNAMVKKKKYSTAELTLLKVS